MAVKLCPMGPSRPDDTKILLEQTKPAMRSLSPEWNEKLKKCLSKKELTQFATFELTIWDYDEWNEDDLMGRVSVHVPIATARSGTTTKWYEVPASSADGARATGEIECSLTTIRKVRTEGGLTGETEDLGSQRNRRPSYTELEQEPLRPGPVEGIPAPESRAELQPGTIVGNESENPSPL